jgi:hypothetical protein
VRNLRHARRRDGGEEEQERLRPDDRVQAERPDELPRDERGDDERRRPGAPHPAVLEALLLRGAERKRIGEHRHRRERRGVQQRQEKKKPESAGWQIAERHRSCERDAPHEDHAQRLQQVADAAGERRRDQANGRARSEHDAKLLGRHAALAYERGKERRCDAVGGVHRGIQQDESTQVRCRECDAKKSQISSVASRWRSSKKR